MAASGSKLHLISRVSNRIQNYLLGYFIQDICIFPKVYACSNLSLSLEVATLKYAEEEITGNSCQNNRIIICHDER